METYIRDGLTLCSVKEWGFLSAEKPLFMAAINKLPSQTAYQKGQKNQLQEGQ